MLFFLTEKQILEQKDVLEKRVNEIQRNHGKNLVV